MGSEEAKDLICVTGGHELRGRITGGSGVPGGGKQRGKNWDNCHNMINKIYFLKLPYFKRKLK